MGELAILKSKLSPDTKSSTFEAAALEAGLGFERGTALAGTRAGTLAAGAAAGGGFITCIEALREVTEMAGASGLVVGMTERRLEAIFSLGFESFES